MDLNVVPIGDDKTNLLDIYEGQAKRIDFTLNFTGKPESTYTYQVSTYIYKLGKYCTYKLDKHFICKLGKHFTYKLGKHYTSNS